MATRWDRLCYSVVFFVLLGGLTQAIAQPLRTVTHVVDGDTIVLENGEIVRLLGIDAPEIKHATKEGAEMGREAAGFARKLLEGKKVRLEFDPSSPNITHKDDRNRTLAYVFLADGTFVNAEMVRQGYAFIIPGFAHQYQEEFQRLQKEAQEKKRGLWKNDS